VGGWSVAIGSAANHSTEPEGFTSLRLRAPPGNYSFNITARASSALSPLLPAQVRVAPLQPTSRASDRQGRAGRRAGGQAGVWGRDKLSYNVILGLPGNLGMCVRLSRGL
jgi:hypothetical protein